MELRTIQNKSDFLSPASCGRTSLRSRSSPSVRIRCGCSKTCRLRQENLQRSSVSHQRATVSSPAIAERLLPSITAKDFTGQVGLYLQVVGNDHGFTAGILYDGMRRQLEFPQHQRELDGRSHPSGRFASL